MKHPLVLTEHVPSDPVRLTVSERDTLRRLVPGLTVEPEPGSADSYKLTCDSTVGIVRVGDLTVELRPKIGVTAVLFLVSYALDPRAWQAEDAFLAPDANLAEALVPLFARTVQRALRPGLLHGYLRREDTLATVRGRVRMADQFRVHTGLPLPVEVVYDDFTPDILENQLLRTAVNTLGSLHLRHTASRAALAQLHLRLNGIRSIAADPRGAPEPHWTRLNERYRPAVSLARLIITSAGLETRAGAQDASAFLIDMNLVFERFLRAALREQLRLDIRAFPSGTCGHTIRLNADPDHPIRLKPDLSWREDGRCVFVGDCKYKRATGSIPNADAYQMLAYLTALQLGEGLLIYAAGEEIPHNITIPNAGKLIQVRTIDVARSPGDILIQIRDLANGIRSIAARARARDSLAA